MVVSRQQYKQAIYKLAMAYKLTIENDYPGKDIKYNDEISGYFHDLLTYYPEPISKSKVAKDIKPMILKQMKSDNEVTPEQLIDKTEELIRSVNDDHLIPFNAMMALNRLRNEYNNEGS